MFISRLKIFLTLVSVFFVLARFASAQQEYRSLGQVPRVTLSASPASAAPGRPVRLVAQLSSGYPNIRFRFAFGDGTQSPWQTSMVAMHTYQSPGNYSAFVDIGVATGSGVTRLGGSIRRAIQVTSGPLGPVELYMTPATAEIGRPVTLGARTASSNPNLRYRFVFGDGSPVGGWQSSPHATHVYESGGAYAASVEVAVMTDRGLTPAGSSRRAITAITPVARNRTTGSKPTKRDAPVSSRPQRLLPLQKSLSRKRVRVQGHRRLVQIQQQSRRRAFRRVPLRLTNLRRSSPRTVAPIGAAISGWRYPWL